MPLTITIPLPDEIVQEMQTEAEIQNTTLEQIAIQRLMQSLSNGKDTEKTPSTTSPQS